MKRIWSPIPTRGGVRLYSAVLLTLGAALIHLAVTPSHFREFAPFGLFFLAVGSTQAILAIELLTRPTQKKSAIIAAASAALVAVWYASRTRGLPFGPTPGVPEAIGLSDVICTLLEVISTLLFASLAIWPTRRQLRRILLIATASIPSALLTTAMTAVAVAATLTEMPAAVSAAPTQPDTLPLTRLFDPSNDAQSVDRFTLVAEQTTIDGQTVYAYNGIVPGPELRVTQGHRVEVTLVNHLPESTTLHWHGLVIPNAADGVAGLTQDAVKPGESFTYEFMARDSGTFWYHSHQQTEAQLPRGLFGAIIVEPDGGLSQTRDYTAVMHGSSGSVSINGQHNLNLEANPGDTVRLRLINAVAPGMDGGPEAPMLLGAQVQVVALDGRDIHDPQPLDTTRIPLGMGQRADLVFTMPASGSVKLVDTEMLGDISLLQRFFQSSDKPGLPTVTLGDGPAPAAISADDAPLFDIATYGTPDVDAVAAAQPNVEAPLVLDKHPGMRDGRPELIHTINGEASPFSPPINVREGDIVRLHIVNNTEEFHPMHLHGHVMTVLARNGVALSGSPIHLDSVLVGPRESYDVAFKADNPGIWMVHCHVLLHAGMGMMTTVNYEGISTPFEMGTRSGNMPE